MCVARLVAHWTTYPTTTNYLVCFWGMGVCQTRDRNPNIKHVLIVTTPCNGVHNICLQRNIATESVLFIVYNPYMMGTEQDLSGWTFKYTKLIYYIAGWRVHARVPHCVHISYVLNYSNKQLWTFL